MEERPEGGKKKRIPSNIPLDLYSALAAPYSKKIVEATLVFFRVGTMAK